MRYIWFSICFFICGCNSDSSLREQAPLEFSMQAPVIFIDSNNFSNTLSGGSGNGTLSWSSSNPDIVSIDSTTGAMTFLDDGVSTISVTKAGNENYLSTSASYQLTVQKYPQTQFSFTQENVTLIYEGPTIHNDILNEEAIAVNIEGVVFSSSEDSVVEVNPQTGELAAKAIGTSLISALIPENYLHLETTIDFEVTVKRIVDGLMVDFETNTMNITWQSIDTGLTLIVSDTPECYQENLQTCSNSNIFNLDLNSEKLISVPQTQNAQYLTLESEQYKTEPFLIEPSEPPFGTRLGARMIKFKGKLWYIGGWRFEQGQNSNDEVIWFNDIWSSEDGIDWQIEAQNAAFSARSDFQLVEYGENLYLIGGNEGSGTRGAYNFKWDVWQSSDGTNWELLVSEAPFLFGEIGKAIVFNDKLYVFADDFNTRKTNIFGTRDGISWNIEQQTPLFDAIALYELYVKDEKLFLFGGYEYPSSDNINQSIYSTSDGVNWQIETPSLPIAGRLMSRVVEHGSKHYLIGGSDFRSNFNSVHISEDGLNWQLLEAPALPRMAQDISVESHEGKLILYNSTSPAELWNSKDGTQWVQSANPELNWKTDPTMAQLY